MVKKRIYMVYNNRLKEAHIIRDKYCNIYRCKDVIHLLTLKCLVGDGLWENTEQYFPVIIIIENV